LDYAQGLFVICEIWQSTKNKEFVFFGMQVVHFWDTRFYADHLMLSSHHTLAFCFHRHLKRPGKNNFKTLENIGC
jgi:hypothetical protein